MNNHAVLKPLKLYESLLFFLLPGFYGLFSFYVFFPMLIRWGISEEFAYGIHMLSVFLLLILVSIITLHREGLPFHWGILAERLRIKRMDLKAWKWAIPFLFLSLLIGLLLNMLGGYVFEKIGFWPPDADITLTNIPFMLVVLVFNIFSEELLWRGVILPRQELTHGKFAFLVNGILWSFFHLSKWWAIPFMLPRQWILPFVAQRTKNTTPGILMHFISNGISVLLTMIAIMSQ